MSLALILASPKTPPPQHHKHHKVSKSRSRRNSTTTTTIHNPLVPRSLDSTPPGAKGACCGCCCWSCCWSYCWTHWAPPSLRGQAGAAGGCNGEWSKAVYPWIPLLEPSQWLVFITSSRLFERPLYPKKQKSSTVPPTKVASKTCPKLGQKHQFRPSSPSEKSIQTIQNIPKLEYGNCLNPSFTSQCQSPAPASETVPAGIFRASGFLSENFRVDVTSCFSPQWMKQIYLYRILGPIPCYYFGTIILNTKAGHSKQSHK